ncbi:MAG: hypothetical protein Q4Q04_04490 [Methanocorpusculum sp.]|nr:hypothetical protein [Methanocorpusculum sp.]
MLNITEILRIRKYIENCADCITIDELAALTGLKQNVVLEYVSYMVSSNQIEEFTWNGKPVYCLSERICVADAFLREITGAVCIIDRNKTVLWTNQLFETAVVVSAQKTGNQFVDRNTLIVRNALVAEIIRSAQYKKAGTGRMPKEKGWVSLPCNDKIYKFIALPVIYGLEKAVMLCITNDG